MNDASVSESDAPDRTSMIGEAMRKSASEEMCVKWKEERVREPECATKIEEGRVMSE